MTNREGDPMADGNDSQAKTVRSAAVRKPRLE